MSVIAPHQAAWDLELTLRPCYLDKLPPEILSEIFLHASDSSDNLIHLRWWLPLCLRRVSKRFYHITTNTLSLWRYLFIRQPLHPYLQKYVARSGNLPLVAYVDYHLPKTADPSAWRELNDVIVPLIPRLKDVSISSPPTNEEPILELLGHNWPILESLDVDGINGSWMQSRFPKSHLPALRNLSASGDFSQNGFIDLPETVEELNLWDENYGDPQPSGGFWGFLPSRLRVLTMGTITWMGMAPTHDQRIDLPCLTELHFKEFCSQGELSILQRLHAPRLNTLAVDSYNDPGAGMDSPDWVLDFPSLAHLEWESWPEDRIASILRPCNALRSLKIKAQTLLTQAPQTPVSDFMTLLVNDPTLLPLLEDLTIMGASITSLTSLAEARPRLRHLRVHRSDLGLEQTFQGGSVDEYVECLEYDEEQPGDHPPL